MAQWWNNNTLYSPPLLFRKFYNHLSNYTKKLFGSGSWILMNIHLNFGEQLLNIATTSFPGSRDFFDSTDERRSAAEVKKQNTVMLTPFFSVEFFSARNSIPVVDFFRRKSKFELFRPQKVWVFMQRLSYITDYRPTGISFTEPLAARSESENTKYCHWICQVSGWCW